MIHLLKGSLGTGILAMPNAFRNGGLAFSLLATIIVGFVCTHTVQILVNSSRLLCRRTRTPALDYAETAQAAFETGPKSIRRYASAAKLFLNSCIVATYYCTSVVYVVFIASSVKQVGDYYTPPDETKWDIRVYMVIFMVPLCMLSLIRKLKYLVPFSALSNVFIILSFCITLAYIFTDMPPLSERSNLASPIQIPLFFSTVIFALEGIGVVMPVENSMKNPSHFLGCPGILNLSMVLIVGLYAVMGFFGYVKYGDDTEGSVTLNLPIKEVKAQVVKILIAAAIVCTYGLQMYVPTQIVWSGLQRYVDDKWHCVAESGFRVGIVFISVAVAAAVPNLGPIISLVGAVCFSTLGLLCPAIIETVTYWDEGLGAGRWRLYKNTVIIIFSLFALIAGSYTSILEIIQAYG
ncbi:proton-coupled amino acid transporter-like protein pathetic [Anabrus simplex]|uniref:proton-coupled amino acid transporter-like protein pathetic n=1 Tax=Anabrus simplex TaxID=316456 RepID=UPI0035A2901A